MKTIKIKVFDHTGDSERTWTKRLALLRDLALKHGGVTLEIERVRQPFTGIRFRAPKLVAPEEMDELRRYIYPNKTWFNQTYVAEAQGYDVALVAVTEKQWDPEDENDMAAWNGHLHNGVCRIMVSATEGQTNEIVPGEKVDEFVDRTLHELCHYVYDDRLGEEDKTHFYDYTEKNLYAAIGDWRRLEDDATDEEARAEAKRRAVEELKRQRDSLIRQAIALLQRRVAKVREKLNDAEDKRGHAFDPQGKLLPLVERKAKTLVEVMALLGHPVRITSGYRSIAEQNEIYAQGRTEPGVVVTNAEGGESLHNYGVAFDLVFRETGYRTFEVAPGLDNWELVGTIGESLGFEWGGRWTTQFVDRPHFQMTQNYSLGDFQSGKIDRGLYN